MMGMKRKRIYRFRPHGMADAQVLLSLSQKRTFVCARPLSVAATIINEFGILASTVRITFFCREEAHILL